MDENNRNDKIDLTNFDLSQFSEVFAEEDAKRIEEKKLEEERLAKEQARRDEEKRRRQAEELRKKQEAERIRLEKEAAERAAKNAQREKEEAKRAAARAAEAAIAAKKAQEARQAATLAASAKMRDNASRDNSILGGGSEKKADFAQISSALDYETVETTQEETPEYLKKEISGKKKKAKGGVFTAIVIILALAVIASLIYALVLFSSTGKPADTAQNQPQAVASEYKPYAGLETAYNKVSYPQGISESLKPMYSQNTDLTGWLTIDGMNIDYPIMRDKNNTYYLNYKNAFDESARYGTPFIDFRCAKTGLSKNTVIYGHHMVNQEHFGSLDNFVNPEFYKQHPVIEYETLTAAYKFKIYAVFYSTTQGSSDGGYAFEYYNPNMSDASFDGYIKMLDQYALYTTEAGLKASDRIITLSTCSHVYDSLKSGGVDTRLVVVGRLLRSGEDESVNTENVTVNSNYRRPQIWYDNQNKTNPYASFRSWSPNK